MKRFVAFFVIILITWTSWAQLTVSVGAVANQGGQASITSYAFDGSATSYFELDQDTMLNSIVDQTWVVRAKVTGDNSQAKGFIGETTGGRLQFEIETDNLIDARINDVAASTISNISWSEDEDYHQFVLVYDSSSGITIYEDGVSQGSNSDTDFQSRADGRIAVLGRANSLNFNGEISDIQFYNRTLTQTEIANLNSDITDLPTDHATSLIANFAGNKTSTTWTSEANSYTATNQGGVTLITE